MDSLIEALPSGVRDRRASEHKAQVPDVTKASEKKREFFSKKAFSEADVSRRTQRSRVAKSCRQTARTVLQVTRLPFEAIDHNADTADNDNGGENGEEHNVDPLDILVADTPAGLGHRVDAIRGRRRERVLGFRRARLVVRRHAKSVPRLHPQITNQISVLVARNGLRECLPLAIQIASVLYHEVLDGAAARLPLVEVQKR